MAHAHTSNKTILRWSFIIIFTYMVIEAIGGYVTNSLALLADAGHMLSDAASLAIALAAFTFGARAANAQKTYGYKRFEIVAAFVNGATLILIALYIFYEAILRFSAPPTVATTGMLIISSIGLAVNLFVAWLMMRGDVEENLNMRGAFLHVISDILGSIGAIVAALCILLFSWQWADPLASVVVAVLVLRSGVYVLRDALHVLMEGAPTSVDEAAVLAILQQPKAVEHVYDVHMWTITSGIYALSAKLVVDGRLTVKEGDALIQTLQHELQHIRISHVTIQLTHEGHDEPLYCTLQATDSHAHHH